MVLTDTVGFISDLPRDLLAAFKATLEELADADLLLHVVDGADAEVEQKKVAVEKLLAELGLGEIPSLLVINKADLLPSTLADNLVSRWQGVAVSALKRSGLRRLMTAAERELRLSEPLLREYDQVSGVKVAET